MFFILIGLKVQSSSKANSAVNIYINRRRNLYLFRYRILCNTPLLHSRLIVCFVFTLIDLSICFKAEMGERFEVL